jgi:hypothetical protein
MNPRELSDWALAIIGMALAGGAWLTLIASVIIVWKWCLFDKRKGGGK